MKRILMGIVVLLLLLAGGLWIWYHPSRPWPPPVSDLRVAQVWLECSDCRGPFLQRLHDARPPARDTLLERFRLGLLFGPDSARRARHQVELMRSWIADSLYRMREMLPPASLQLPEFMRSYSRGLDVTWRTRSATALGVMRDPLAIAALDSALQLPLQTRADSEVRVAVLAARADSGLGAIPGVP